MFSPRYRRIRRAGGVTPRLLALPVLVGLVVSGLYLAAAVLNARLFTQLLTDRDLSRIAVLIVAVATVWILRPLVDVLGQAAQNRAGLTLKRNLRRALLAEVDRVGPMRVGLGRSGTLQSVLTDGVEAVEPYYIKYATQLVVTAVTVIGLTIALAWISMPVAAVLLVCGLAVVAIPRLWDRALAERGQSHWAAYETLNADVIDAMMGMGTLKSFGAARAHGARLHRQSRELLDSTLGQLRLSLGETGLSSTCKVLGPALALLLAIAQVRAGQLDVSRLFLVTMLSVELFRPFSALSALWHESFFGIAALTSMSELFDRAGADRARGFSTGAVRGEEGIWFEGVTYRYLGADEDALHDVTFDIEARRTTAIVGYSGSGKSTALGLLMGFDAPRAGCVRVFGRPAHIDGVADLVTLVPQDPIIFPGTVREILAQANPDASEAAMLRALRVARADTLAGAGGAILDLAVAERATNLSGGQKQRLAIARALVRGTPVLVLDESTSALDTGTERELLAGLRETYPDLTLILVTHRLDVAARADRILVFADHTLAEAGVPAALDARDDGVWRALRDATGGAR